MVREVLSVAQNNTGQEACATLSSDQTMNVLIVYAHPEPKSFNGAMKDLAVEVLDGAGHAVRVSDLYAMKWESA